MALIIFFELSSNYLRDENDLPRTMSKGILPNRFSLCPPPFPPSSSKRTQTVF